jgi:hypothetical protein
MGASSKWSWARRGRSSVIMWGGRRGAEEGGLSLLLAQVQQLRRKLSVQFWYKSLPIRVFASHDCVTEGRSNLN